MKLPDIVPISDLRRETADLLKRVRETRKPVVVTQRGRAAAVLMSVEEHERREHDLELLTLLARGEREIEKGEGYGLDEVMERADEILASPSEE